MYMSGTSMAAPVVSGTVALLLDTNPNLKPNLVKAILMYSAQPLSGFNTVEQGAGEINIDGAVRLSKFGQDHIADNERLGYAQRCVTLFADERDRRSNR